MADLCIGDSCRNTKHIGFVCFFGMSFLCAFRPAKDRVKNRQNPKKTCFISTTGFGPGPNQVEPDLFNLPCSLLFHGRGVHGGNKSSMYKNCTFCKKDGSI